MYEPIIKHKVLDKITMYISILYYLRKFLKQCFRKLTLFENIVFYLLRFKSFYIRYDEVQFLEGTTFCRLLDAQIIESFRVLSRESFVVVVCWRAALGKHCS